MKDPEVGEVNRADDNKATITHKVKGKWTAKKMLAGAALAFGLVVLVFGIGLFASHCEYLFRSKKEYIYAEPVENGVHQLDRRGDCNETAMSSAEAVTLGVADSASIAHFITGGSIAIVTQVVVPVGISVPISTQTAISVIYSISSPLDSTTVTKTATKTASVILPTEPPICSAGKSTLTVTVTVVPTPTPTSSKSSTSPPWAQSSVLGDVTVTGGGSTVTHVNTELLFTSGLPDATISGNPSTLTDVQTDISLTSGLPDATVSGNPLTVTNVKTGVSLTEGLPDATVSGRPSTITDLQTSVSPPSRTVTSILTVVISDLWGSTSPAMVTVTETSTAKSTITTVQTSPVVTITKSFPQSASTATLSETADTAIPTTIESIVTEYLTTTYGLPVTSITTVLVPSSFPAPNGTASGQVSGTITSITTPTTPVVISSGKKKPEPHAWGGNGSGNVGCLVMLIAIIMFML